MSHSFIHNSDLELSLTSIGQLALIYSGAYTQWMKCTTPRANFMVEFAQIQLDLRRVLFTHVKKLSIIVNSNSPQNNLLFIIFQNSIKDA